MLCDVKKHLKFCLIEHEMNNHREPQNMTMNCYVRKKNKMDGNTLEVLRCTLDTDLKISIKVQFLQNYGLHILRSVKELSAKVRI